MWLWLRGGKKNINKKKETKNKHNITPTPEVSQRQNLKDLGYNPWCHEQNFYASHKQHNTEGSVPNSEVHTFWCWLPPNLYFQPEPHIPSILFIMSICLSNRHPKLNIPKTKLLILSQKSASLPVLLFSANSESILPIVPANTLDSSRTLYLISLIQSISKSCWL